MKTLSLNLFLMAVISLNAAEISPGPLSKNQIDIQQLDQGLNQLNNEQKKFYMATIDFDVNSRIECITAIDCSHRKTRYSSLQ